MSQANSASTWFSDAHTVLSVVGILLMGAMSFVGWKVHQVLFGMKIPERMAVLEENVKSHEKRLDRIESKV